MPGIVKFERICESRGFYVQGGVPVCNTNTTCDVDYFASCRYELIVPFLFVFVVKHLTLFSRQCALQLSNVISL